MTRKLTIEDIPLDQIDTDATARDPGRDLIHSLKRCGRVLIPILVRCLPDGRYQLVDGSRRLAAARELQWATIPGVVEPPGESGLSKDLEAIEINRQRANLRLQHVALHARQALASSDYNQTELAAEINMSGSLLSSILKVWDCADLVKAMDDDGLDFGAVRALAGLLPADRCALLDELRAVRTRDGRFPTIREIETRVKELHGHAALAPFAPESAPDATLELVTRGVPCEIKVVYGRHTRLRLTLTVGEADEPWIRDLLATLSPGKDEGTG